MSFRSKTLRAANRLISPFGFEIVRNDPARTHARQLRSLVRRFGIDRVIDVGANQGQFAMELLQDGYAGAIDSIEPLPEPHAVLFARAARFPRWKVFDAVAVGATESSEVRMEVAGNSVSSSILPMLELHVAAAPRSRPVGHVNIRQTTLDALYPDGVRGPALLKVDTQGYERQVLQGGVRLLRSVAAVDLELSLAPLYEGQPDWLEVIHWMRQHGFAVWSIAPEFHHPDTMRLLQVNGIFVRAD